MKERPLKLGLVTPWNARSAIAKVNLAIARELRARNVDVSIGRAERGDALASKPLSKEFSLLPGAGIGAQAEDGLDIVCYAVGNHYPFHGGAIEMLASRPGIVLLHDFYLGHLADEWAHAKGTEDGIPRLHRLVYGAQPPATADMEWLAANQPLVEWPSSMSIGAVVHAAHYYDRVAAACPGPVVELPLPAEDRPVPAACSRSPGDPFTLVTVGHVNANKLPEEVIRAIGSSARLQTQCSYRLLGPVEDSMRAGLQRLAETLGVKAELTGWLTDDALYDALEASDAIMCLRRPILEGASMSALVGLLTARPTIVCDAGFYAEIPDDCALKVPADAPLPEIVRRLGQVLDDPAGTASLAARGQRWVRKGFTAGRYADGILSMTEEVLRIDALVSMARRQSSLISGWGLRSDDPLMMRIGHLTDALFG